MAVCPLERAEIHCKAQVSPSWLWQGTTFSFAELLTCI